MKNTDEKIELRIKEFEKFYYFLMKNAPEEYQPWFFPCEPNGKNPSTQAILKLNPTSKGSWHHESARLNKERCIEHIKNGYNIGISARTGDPLIIGDIDSSEFLNQLPTDTLTVTSRKRAGAHFFGWDKDGTAKINLPTDGGEIRSDNQYVLSCGSYVPFDLKSVKDKKAFDDLPNEAKKDELLGYYTVKDSIIPKEITFTDFPKFFQEKEQENIEAEANIKQAEERKEFSGGGKGEGKYTELFKLKVSDILEKIPEKKRVGHPLHESDTDANFSLSKDGSIAHCWRHLVSLNAVQYLCVKTGYAKCEDAGTPHKGRGLSKIKGDKKAFEAAYQEALKIGLIKEYVLKGEGKEKRKPKLYMNSYVDEENQIMLEQIYDKTKGSGFCLYNHNTGNIKYSKKFIHNQKTYYPEVGEEIEKGAIILPSTPKEYGTNEELDEEIKKFIKKWLDVPEDIIMFGIWNTKRSWVYDKFHTINYLRALGDTGTGKSRYLDTFGQIHYKPIFTTGATTAAPLFRILDKWKGTLVMDEADFKYSDESADIIKIINQGYEKGSFIMRCDQNDASKISFFEPYGPKILATRKTFQDKATESRCITHVMNVTEKKEIPVNLNEEFYKEAKSIRDKLLMWRFKNYFEIDLTKQYDLGDIEPRVKQIVSSYIALFSNNKKQMEEFKNYIKEYQEDLIEERRTSFEGEIIGVIYSLLENEEENITSKMIVEKGGFLGRTGKPMNPRSLNSYLKTLGFKKSKVEKVHGKSKRIIPIDKKHINKLFKRYGYEVTVLRSTTETSQLINNSKKDKINTNLDNFVTKIGGGVPLRIDRNLRNCVTDSSGLKDENEDLILEKKAIKDMTEEELRKKVLVDYKSKEYKDFGAVDFEDHQTEQAEEQYKKDREEIEE